MFSLDGPSLMKTIKKILYFDLQTNGLNSWFLKIKFYQSNFKPFQIMNFDWLSFETS